MLYHVWLIQNTYGQLGSTNADGKAVADLSMMKIVFDNFIFDMLVGFPENFIRESWE